MIDVKALTESMLKQVHAYVSPVLTSIDKRIADVEGRIKELPAEVPDVGAVVREAIEKMPAAKDGADGKDGKDGDPAIIAQAVATALEGLKVAPEIVSALVADGIEKALPGAVQKGIEAIMPDLVARAAQAVPVPANGKDGLNGKDAEPVSIEVVTDLVSKAVSSIPAPRDGKDGLDAPAVDVEYIIESVVKKIPAPKNGVDGRDGRDADPEFVRLEIAKAVDLIPRPAAGRDGRDAVVDVDSIVKTVTAAIPVPKDGKDGLNGNDGKDGASVHKDDVIQAIAPLAKSAAIETAEIELARIGAEIPKPQTDHDGETFLKEFSETIQAWGASVE